jgi:DNA repair exonuclease SbcCD ATPase subunit
MGGEQVRSLPEDLERWVERRAADLDADETEVVARALTAYRLVEENGDGLEAAAAGDGRHDDRLDDLSDRVEVLESDLDEKITDVRERVIQVKRETDRKAPADHDHDELETQVRAAADDVADLRATVETLDDRLGEGFDNYEEVLEYLTDATESLEEKLDVVASAALDLRERTAALERTEAERAAGAELKREANGAGVSSAVCETCGESVDLSLLEAPYCPSCNATFDGVRPKRGFFGTATLTVGSRPALESDTDDPPGEETPETLFEEAFED